MTTRIGFGYDVHAFTSDRPLILGGVTIPFAQGLSGHSDADTVIHAIVDALLGAAALGDIGTHFPSSDHRWENQPGSVFLDYTYNLLCQHRSEERRVGKECRSWRRRDDLKEKYEE